jgi:hypothetical protein
VLYRSHRTQGRTILVVEGRRWDGLVGGLGRSPMSFGVLGIAPEDRPRRRRPMTEIMRDHRALEAAPTNWRAAVGEWTEYIPTGDPTRPQPGIETRLRDHDAVKLFANVYRLGHPSEFTWARILELCSW